MDYNSYTMKRKEYIFYYLIYSIGIFALGYIFYRNTIISIVLIVFVPFFINKKKKNLAEKRRGKLNIQFRELLFCIASSLRAGKSLEGAINESLKDLIIIYNNREEIIIKEVESIIKKIKMNTPIEEAVYDFAQRSKLEDIINFADVLNICKRTGGDVIYIVKSSSDIIGEKISMKSDIEVLISSKVLESKLLLIVPVLVILMLSTTSYDYIEPMYTTFLGRIIMTTAIIILYISYLMIEKIISIKL